MEFIDNKLRRYTTFSKRKTGIMKKAYELSTLTGKDIVLKEPSSAKWLLQGENIPQKGTFLL